LLEVPWSPGGRGIEMGGNDGLEIPSRGDTVDVIHGGLGDLIINKEGGIGGGGGRGGGGRGGGGGGGLGSFR